MCLHSVPLLVRIRKPARQPGRLLGWCSHLSLTLAEPWRRAPWSRGCAGLGGRAVVSLEDQGKRVLCSAGVSTGGCRAKRSPGCQAGHRPADRHQHCALCLVHPSSARRGGHGGHGGWTEEGLGGGRSCHQWDTWPFTEQLSESCPGGITNLVPDTGWVSLSSSAVMFFSFPFFFFSFAKEV